MVSGRIRSSSQATGRHTGDAAFLRALVAIDKAIGIVIAGIGHGNWGRRKGPYPGLDSDPDHSSSPSPSPPPPLCGLHVLDHV